MTSVPRGRLLSLALVLAVATLVAIPTAALAEGLGPAGSLGGARTVDPTPSAGTASPLATASPIKHVIIIIQENHGIDNYFSQYPGAFGVPPDGIPQPGSLGNVTWYANPYTLNWNYNANQSSSIPDHDVTAIRGNVDNGSMDGYTYTDTNVSIGYYPSYIVANELGLAQEYGLADNYFHAFAGPTLPNRFYDYAITSGTVLSNSGPLNGSNIVDFNSLPRELEQNGISWGDYDGNYNEDNGTPCFIISIFPNCPSWYFQTTLSQLMPMLYFNWIQQYAGQLGHEQPYSQLYSDLYTGNLPSVSWYTQDWLNGTEHPGTIAGFGGNVTQGQEGILGIVRAVEDSPYWNSTAIFLTYDEGGGFFDSVPPPQINAEGDGVRIPLVVISPYAKEGYVSHEYYTPSSLLHFVEWNWNLPPLGALDGEANLPLDFFNFSATPRAPLPQSVYALPGEQTSFPWSYTQPVSSSLLGKYEPALVSHGNVSWAVQTNNDLAAPAAQTPDGRIVYLAGMDGILRAIDPVWGGTLWTADLGSASWSAPAILPGDGALTATLRGQLTGFAANGTVLWNFSLGAPIYRGLTLVQGNYYGATTNGSLFAVSANGTLLWYRHVTDGGIYAAPTYDPSTGYLLASATQSGVVAVNLAGTVQWIAHVYGAWGAPAVANGVAYVTTTDGGVYPITTSSGTIGTPAALPGDSVTSPAIIGDTLYAGNDTGFLQAYALPGLTPTWSASLYGDVAGAPVDYQNHLWVTSGGGDLYEFPLTGGPAVAVQHALAVFASAPLATSTGLFVTAEDGNLYGFNNGGWLHLQVTPGTANVTVGGTPVSLAAGSASLVLPGGPVSVVASATGYVTQTLSPTVVVGRATWLNITLSPTSVHPGTLGVDLTPGTATLSVNGTAIPNSPTGLYAISENPGPLVLQASDPGYLTQTGSATIVSGLTSWWNVTLQPAGSGMPGYAVGTVSNLNTTLPVAEATVVLTTPGGGTTLTTASNGTYRVELNAGPYAAFVNESGYHPYVGSFAVTSSQTTTADFVLTPLASGSGLPPGTLTGVVYNTSASGPTLPGISLLVLPGDHTAVTGSGGSYSLSLPPATYGIFVNATGYDPFVVHITIVSGQTGTQDIFLAPLPRSCTTCSSTSNGNSTPTNWLLLAILLAAVVAALLFLAVVVRKKNREKGGGGAGGMVAYAGDGSESTYVPHDPGSAGGNVPDPPQGVLPVAGSQAAP